MKNVVFILSILSFCLAFIGLEPLFEKPSHFPAPVYDFEKNPLSAEKIELGKALFYDPILSKNNTISCESCHSPYSAFTHIDHALSHGINDSIGTRNSPALFNLAWQKQFMWDGAINHLEVQALAPISHPAEMGSSIAEVVNKLNASKKYKALFYTAYKDSVATGERTLKTLAQFMLTLVSANSKYDQVLKHEAEFTKQENKGYQLFKLHCATCHAEPLLSSYGFENNALPLDSNLKDLGRMRITKRTVDSLFFKVPSLRNVEYSYPYMHDGRFKKLSEVINHYSAAVTHNKRLAERMKRSTVFSPEEKVELISFLLTATDRAFAFNLQHRPKK